MIVHYKKHLINHTATVTEVLERLNELATDAIVFIHDDDGVLQGSLTDGDIRRGFLNGHDINSSLIDFMHSEPKVLRKNEYCIEEVIALREKYKIIPVLDRSGKVVTVLNFRFVHSYLPLDAVIMAGGRGERLRPLTDTTPKPLLKVGEKPIIEHNMHRLVRFGVDDFWVSIRYLGQQLIDYFGNGSNRGVSIGYVTEDTPLGTIGAVSQIDNFNHEVILVMNSDLLTNIDYENFYLDFIEKDADMSVATVPYSVNVPYAVLNTANNHIISFKEKPTYTYYANGGIYLIKKTILEQIPKNTRYDSTDLMEELINQGKRVVSYPMANYWLDIGKLEDYEKAQIDIKHLNLE